MPLKNNKQLDIKNSVVVDDCDRYLLDKYSWYVTKQGYVYGGKIIMGVRHRNSLHHLVIGKPPIGMCVDHKNGNKLDNRRINLHFVTYSYNLSNKKKRVDSTQPLKGIQLLPYGRWRARGSGGKQIGIFNTPVEAYNAFINYSENKLGEKLYALT